MDFFSKMMQTFSSILLPKEINDDELFSQITVALQEESSIWNTQNDFIEPDVIENFQNKWSSAYYTAKKKTARLSFPFGLFRRKNDNTALHFLEVYEQMPQKLRQYNDRAATRKALAAANLILPVEGKQLDTQQMNCITKEVRNHLVLAGAGTGKTTTIVGYVKYLLKSGTCKPEDILVLSFTNASAAEMSQRLTVELGTSVAASTFHKLGLDIITSVQGKKPKIYSADIRQYVRQQLDVLIQNNDYLKRLCIYLTYSSTVQKSEFDFKTDAEYQEYLKYNPPVTLGKETVKSHGELDIANFLRQNGISYVYEPEYPVDTRTSEYGQYHPDFYLPNFDVYIEYFGINRDGEVPPYFTGKNGMTASQTYQEGMKWKRELHRQNGTRMIEVYAYEKFEEQLLPNLEDKLKKAGVIFTPLSPEEMWLGIGDGNNQKLDRVAELFGTVITLIKSNNCTLTDVRERNQKLHKLSGIDAVLDLIDPIYHNYQKELCQKGEVDFNDMINLAAEYVQTCKYIHAYRYVIVDEYQDISQSRYRLLAVMRQQKDYRLFCVGDDWQSIYRFSGSDIGFILNFEKYWGASEISRIETTYRFPQSLIEVSSSFIMRNPEQKEKSLRSAAENYGFSVERITGFTDRNSVEFLAERLKDLPGNSSVLFLGRYRFDIKMFQGHKLFSYQYDTVEGRTKVNYTRRPDLKISFMTIHSSKGLQADYVFLLNNKAYGMGFPSQIADAPVLQLLLDNCDHYPFAEERRLFYVAITRAKKKVWLIANKGNESEFIKEIDKMYGDAMRREQYTCPLCGGRLVRRTGPYGDFFGCTNYKTHGCRYIRNITKSQM